MATNEFELEVRTAAREVIHSKVTEVVLPAYRGERGVLAGHENFVGLLGTGVLKFVRGGDDYWYVIGSGVYEVREGKLIVLTDIFEDPKQISTADSAQKIAGLEAKLATGSQFDRESETLSKELKRERARVEAHRRTELVN